MRYFLRNRRLQLALYLLGCMAAGALWALFHGIPEIARMVGVREEVKQARLGIAHLAREAEEIPARRAALASAESELMSILGTLPCEDEIPEVVRDFARRANGWGLEVLDADFELETIFGPVEGSGHQISRMPFRLLLLGRYAGVGHFLEELAEQTDYVEWQSVSLDRSTAGENTVEATISMNLYALVCESREPARRSVAMAVNTIDGRAR